MARRVLHIPNPKGGAKRAFDIPLSREMIKCIGGSALGGYIHILLVLAIAVILIRVIQGRKPI